MFFGVQYYRHPFPYPHDWERDIRHMKELHFNVVKLWAVWNTIERQPGTFDFSELDTLVRICGENDLKVIINTVPEGAPYWTETLHPDALYRTAEGQELHFSGPANIPSAGWPGLCLDSAQARALTERFIRETAAHFAPNENVIAIDVWNEPHLEPMFDYSGQLLCYCEHSITAFREWLKNRYHTIEALNAAWFRCYKDFEQVMPPVRFGTYADMVDWRRFWLYNLAEWLKCRVEAARSGAPGKIIQSHSAFSGYMGALNQGGLGNELADEFLLARHTDMYGLSSFPLWLMGEEHVIGHLLNVEIIAEAAGDKPFYQVELQGGAGKAGLLGGLVPSAADIRQWNWNIIALGGKGAVYWQYAPEPSGMESPGFGLVDSVGGDTPRSLSASECARMFDQDYLTNAVRVLPVNGIYLSRTSDLITYAAKEEEKYNASFKGIYRMLLDTGIPARFVHGDMLEKAIAQGMKVLYLPMTLALSENEIEVLTTFAKNGGRLIIEGCTGMYGENAEMDVQFTFLKTVLGMEHVVIEAIKGGKETAHLETGGSFNCAYYRQTFKTCSPDVSVLACYADGTAAAMRMPFGKGEIVWIAGFAGAQYNAEPDDNTREFIVSQFDSSGYDVLEALESNGLLIRMLQSGDRYYIVAVNHSGAERSFTAKLTNRKTVSETVAPTEGKIIPV